MMTTVDMMMNDISKVDTKTNFVKKDSMDVGSGTTGKSTFKVKFEDELNKFNRPQEKNFKSNENSKELNNKFSDADNKLKKLQNTTSDNKNVEEDNKVELEDEKDCDDKSVNKELIELLQSLLNNSKLNNENPLKPEDINKINSMIEELTKNNSIDLSKLKEILVDNKLIPLKIEENNLVGNDFNSQLQDLLNLMKENNDTNLDNDKLKQLIDKVLNKVETLPKVSKIDDLGLNKKSIAQVKVNINNTLKANTESLPKDSESISRKDNSVTPNNQILNKDDKFLNGLLEEDNSYKNTKVMMFGTMNSEKQQEKTPTMLPNVAIGDVKNLPLQQGQPIENISATTMVNKDTMVQDVVKNIKFMETANLKELTVRMNPKDLGEIVIRLSLENNEMKAKILSANKDTYGLLNSNLNEIKNNLAAQNFKVNEISVNIYFQDSTTYGEFKEGQGYQERNEGSSYNGGQNSSENGEDALIDETEDIYKDSNINMLA